MILDMFAHGPNVEYLEKPATEDERAVASLIERAIAAFNESNLEDHLAVYADTAHILPPFSRRHTPFTKKEYVETLRGFKATQRGKLHLRHAVIRILEGGREASISGILNISFPGSIYPWGQKVGRYYQCAKISQKWYITRTGDV